MSEKRCPRCGLDKYRLLCWNCNLSHGLYGYCPHEVERVEEIA